MITGDADTLAMSVIRRAKRISRFGGQPRASGSSREALPGATAAYIRAIRRWVGSGTHWYEGLA
jgi:hypothetical protein